MVESIAVADSPADNVNPAPSDTPAATLRTFPAEIRAAFQPVTATENGEIELHEGLARAHNGRSSAQLLHQLTPDNRADYDRVFHDAAFRTAHGQDDNASLMLAIDPAALAEPGRQIDTLLLRADSMGIAPTQIVLSIHEDTSEAASPRLKQICRVCRQNHVRTALAGFGSGSNGLGRLTVMRPSYLKLDSSFSRGIANDLRRRVIIASIVGMALELGADVIASDVGTGEEAAAFAECGVAFLQGSLIGEPVLEQFTTQADLALPRQA